jgi:hypothetical protein
MGKATFAPDQITALPGAAAAAFAWRSRGQLQVTVVAKATFAFAPDAAMTPAEPQEVLLAEVYHQGLEGRVVRFASDWAPYLSRADVVFTGHAYAPPGAAALMMPVRVAIQSEDRVLLDKTLLVQDKAPFSRMPVRYDRAAAGADSFENPFGISPQGPDAPNIVDPRDPSHPAGFGPIARAWPSRKRLLGDTPRDALERPIQEIPDNFHWSYFQSAPPDQQTAHLRGDEWIALQGLHPERPELRTQLPKARGVARVYGLSAFGVAEGQPLDLLADCLRIDGDEQRATLTLRRSFPVPNEAALAWVRIVAGVEFEGLPVAWPPPPAAPYPEAQSTTLELGPEATGSAVPAPPHAPLRFIAQTLDLPPPVEEAVKARPPLPFEPAPPGALPALLVRPPGPVIFKEHLHTGTLALSAGDEDHPRAPARVALPFPPPLPPESPIAEESLASEKDLAPRAPEPAVSAPEPAASAPEPAASAPEPAPSAEVSAPSAGVSAPSAEVSAPAPLPKLKKPRADGREVLLIPSNGLKEGLYRRFERK